MNAAQLFASLPALAGVAVVACGTTITSGGGPGGSCRPPYVACDLVDAATVNQALPGLGFAAGAEDDMAGSGALPNSYGCAFSGGDPGASFSLTVACNPGNLMNGSVVYDAAMNAAGGDNTPVSGLGDYAFWHTPSGGAAGPRVLAVFFGGNGSFELAITLPSGSSVDAEAGLRQLATGILAKL